MSSKETMLIAFPNGGILPASITGDKDKPVDPHDPVRVPRDYGEHLVHDRFAYEPAPKGKKGKGAPDDDTAAKQLEAGLVELRKKVEETADVAEKAKLAEAVAEAEKKLADLAGKG